MADQPRSKIVSELFIGIMSGTSLDGIDVVLADFSAAPRLLASHSIPMPQDLVAQLLALNTPGFDDLRLAQEASVAVTRLYAEATCALLDKSAITAQEIQAIGCHGQTVRHRPQDGYTLQLQQPALLAELTGISVAADFRSRDIAAGGQGAPLVPAFHQCVLGDAQEHRAVLNLGGIANVTQLKPGAPVIGFDTGPANILMDAWCQQHSKQRFDAHGAWARSGQVDGVLLTRCLSHPFFAAKPPKSCGREEFSLAWLTTQLGGKEATADVQATLAELTALSAASAIKAWYGAPERLLLCGGGARNDFLRERIALHLPGVRVERSDVLGVPGDWLEAFAFAWLAYRLWHHLPGNLPEVTGATGLRLLGAIYPA
jgi:anhydro-N-acetylmuramic acid kinase